MDQAFSAKSCLPRVALLIALSTILVGCGGGDGDSAPTGSKPSSSTPPATAPTPASNQAPTLSGAAATSVVANSSYSFTPSADDPEGDALAFQITNKPSWATFDTVTGRLSGQPTLAHAGDYPNIVISVNDGKNSAALPAFAIKVNGPVVSSTISLAWTAPTQNEDGSVLSDLAGYTIVYGGSSSTLDKSVRIDNPGIDRYVFDGLPAGTYYFGVRAFTSTGAQSTTSNIVSRTIG